MRRAVVATLGTNVVLAILGLATSVMAARLLGPGGRGELAAIMLLATLLAGPALLGLGESVTYHAARQPGRARAYVTAGAIVALMSAVIFVGLGRLLTPVLLSDQPASVVAAASTYLWYLALAACTGIPHQALRGIGAFALWNALRILPSVLWLIILAVGWATAGAAAPYLATFYLAGQAALALPMTLMCLWPLLGNYRAKKREIGSLVGFGLPVMLGSLPQLVASRIDQIAIVAIFSNDALGLYAVSVAWASMVQPVIGSISAVLLPAVASKSAPEERVRVFAKAVRVSVLVTASIFGSMVVATPLLFTLMYGSAFQGAVPVAAMLCAAASITALTMVIEEGLRGMGYPRYVMWAELAGACASVPVTLLLTVRYELLGAAAAAVFASSLVLVTLVLQAKLRLGMGLRDMLVPRAQEVRTLIGQGIAVIRFSSRPQ